MTTPPPRPVRSRADFTQALITDRRNQRSAAPCLIASAEPEWLIRVRAHSLVAPTRANSGHLHQVPQCQRPQNPGM